MREAHAFPTRTTVTGTAEVVTTTREVVMGVEQETDLLPSYAGSRADERSSPGPSDMPEYLVRHIIASPGSRHEIFSPDAARDMPVVRRSTVDLAAFVPTNRRISNVATRQEHSETSVAAASPSVKASIPGRSRVICWLWSFTSCPDGVSRRRRVRPDPGYVAAGHFQVETPRRTTKLPGLRSARLGRNVVRWRRGPLGGSAC